VRDEDVALADARPEYLVVGDVVFLSWGDRPDQIAAGDDDPADLREAALLDDGSGRGQQVQQFREQGLKTGAGPMAGAGAERGHGQGGEDQGSRAGRGAGQRRRGGVAVTEAESLGAAGHPPVWAATPS
jgi:hypothetical protein